jgi:predicted TIM-barrel fold metal-dependent hydrolase
LKLAAILAAELVRGKEIRPFDTHAHTGADVDGTTRSSDEHVRDLEAVGGRSVIFPLCVTSGYEAENRRVVEECGRHPDRLVPFARLDPRVSGAGDAANALAGGARGFKLHPRSEAFGLEHPNVEAIVAVAAEAKAPVLIHAGAGVGSFGSTIVELAAGHRQCPIILAHAGISDLSWLSRVVPEQPNLFFDTAWIVPADLLALFALVPPGRILYGSDAPYMDVELLTAITLRCAHFTGLAPETIALVMGGQLERLLAGEAPLDAGPAPGPAATALSPGENRVVSLLSGAGGCMLGGGDPSQSLELAQLALADTPAGDGQPSVLAELIEECRSPSPDAIRALVLALTLAATPGLVSEALVD